MQTEKKAAPLCLTLENEALRVEILPHHGGKIKSIFYKKAGFELLYQTDAAYRPARLGDDFSHYETCGLDDAFPSINAQTVTVKGQPVEYPDHGEIWSAPMTHRQDGDAIILSVHSGILPYSYQKRLSLVGEELLCEYRIENTGAFSFPYIWAFHGLFNYKSDMRIVLPPDTKELENVLAARDFGPVGQRYAFPLDTLYDGQAWDFRTVCSPLKEGMAKYYVAHAVSDGVCGYDYPADGVRVRVSFDPKKLPYVGFWITTGGFKGEANCALEPATGYYDSIDIAQKNEACSTLSPGEVFTFSLSVAVHQIHLEQEILR